MKTTGNIRIKIWRFSLLFSILTFILFVIAIPSVQLYKRWVLFPEAITDIQQYTEGYAVEYEGGKAALDFFPDYSELSDYTSIAYEYRDNTIKNYVDELYYPIFVLDVTYTKEKYLAERQSFPEEPIEHWSDGFDSVYEKNNSESSTLELILTNDSEMTVRYVVMFGAFSEYESPSEIYYWNY